MSTARLWSDNLNIEGVLEFIRSLMRDDFYNSDRRSSLSVLLVTLNASNKSLGRRQETRRAPKKPGAFCFSFALRTKKSKGVESFLKHWALIMAQTLRRLFTQVGCTQRVHEVKSRASRSNPHRATTTPNQTVHFYWLSTDHCWLYCTKSSQNATATFRFKSNTMWKPFHSTQAACFLIYCTVCCSPHDESSLEQPAPS